MKKFQRKSFLQRAKNKLCLTALMLPLALPFVSPKKLNAQDQKQTIENMVIDKDQNNQFLRNPRKNDVGFATKIEETDKSKILSINYQDIIPEKIFNSNEIYQPFGQLLMITHHKDTKLDLEDKKEFPLLFKPKTSEVYWGEQIDPDSYSIKIKLDMLNKATDKLVEIITGSSEASPKLREIVKSLDEKQEQRIIQSLPNTLEDYVLEIIQPIKEDTHLGEMKIGHGWKIPFEGEGKIDVNLYIQMRNSQGGGSHIFSRKIALPSKSKKGEEQYPVLLGTIGKMFWFDRWADPNNLENKRKYWAFENDKFFEGPLVYSNSGTSKEIKELKYAIKVNPKDNVPEYYLNLGFTEKKEFVVELICDQEFKSFYDSRNWEPVFSSQNRKSDGTFLITLGKIKSDTGWLKKGELFQRIFTREHDPTNLTPLNFQFQNENWVGKGVRKEESFYKEILESGEEEYKKITREN